MSPLYLLLSVRPKVSCPAGSSPGVGLTHRANRLASRLLDFTILMKGVSAPEDESSVKLRPCISTSNLAAHPPFVGAEGKLSGSDRLLVITLCYLYRHHIARFALSLSERAAYKKKSDSGIKERKHMPDAGNQ